MNNKLFVLVGIITIVISNILLIKYYNIIVQRVNKKIKIVLLYIIIIVFSILIFTLIIKDINEVNEYFISKKYSEEFEIMNSKIQEEEHFYKDIINSEYDVQGLYIPENFKYVEGTIQTGYVIEDINKNQYVWVPCSNKETDKCVKLQKSNFGKIAFFYKEGCYDIEYKDFIKSALKYGGFYISRFEIGNENGNPVSKYGAEVYNNISRNQAKQIVDKMYNEDDEIKCEIINGFAYDTTLLWIQKNNEIKIFSEDYSKINKTKSGRNEAYNNIFDITDNMMEITLENYYDAVVVRGNSISNIINDFTGNKYNEESRHTIVNEDETLIFYKDSIAIRTVIYKR